MKRDGQEEATRDRQARVDDRELLEARRRKLGDKLKSRGLITDDRAAEQQDEQKPAQA